MSHPRSKNSQCRRAFHRETVEPLERRVLMSAVVGRFIFYNNSAFDGRDPAATAADDAAIAADKSALLPGQRATFANYTSYATGINGVFVDLDASAAMVGADDFDFRAGRQGAPDSWSVAPSPNVAVRAGAGVNGSNRVTLTWPDGAIRNQWLSVTVKANADTGLAAPDVFYFGNLVGDAVTAGDTDAALVSYADVWATRSRIPSLAGVTSPYDLDRDRRVSPIDMEVSRRNVRRSLPLFTAPSTAGDLSFFVPVQLQGQTPVTLHPVESILPNQPVRVSFGVPFPRGFVPSADLSRVRLLDDAGAERPAYVELLTPWRDLATGTDLPSARSVLVQSDVTFPDADGDGDADPLPMAVEWGRAARTLPSPARSPARQGWVLYDNAAAPAGTDFNAADSVYEPPAYALFTPEWYGQAVIKTRLVPFGSDPDFAAYDAAFRNFGDTAINDVDPRVTAANLIHYQNTDEPWLFDRAMALYQLAFRSGNIAYLREAHRNAQFYANHISPQGYFDLKGDDLKYVYGESISADYWLTGDDRLIGVHRLEIPMFDRGQTAAYSPGHFWTERHAAYKLLGYVTGFELLGDPTLAQKARDTFTTYVNHQNNPPAGAPNTGMLMHLKPDHGEGGTTEWIASPWMSVLLIDAVERYYVHSADPRVDNFVTRMADGINDVGNSMYYSDALDGVTHLQPYYLAGPGLTPDQREIDEWGDAEHAVDVSKIFALAYYFTRQAGAPNATYLGRFEELRQTEEAVFQYWTRPGGPAAGLAVYRMTPARKFNWWFRTTANRDWLLGDPNGNSPVIP
jgi:hypothetical protein